MKKIPVEFANRKAIQSHADELTEYLVCVTEERKWITVYGRGGGGGGGGEW